MATAERGFGSMDKAAHRKIASKGGKAAHALGVGHEWTTGEAREAGRKGGLKAARIKAEKKLAALLAKSGCSI